MSYYARTANQWIAWRDLEVGRVNEEVGRVDKALAELAVEFEDASEPDNAEALREALASWEASRDEAQAEFDGLVAEIQALRDGIPSDEDIDTAEAARDDLRDPYMVLYNQWQAETDATARTQLEAQMAEQRPALDAAQTALDALVNRKNRNTGRIPGKERQRDSVEVALNTYIREVQKFTNRLTEPSERQPGIQTQIDYFTERKAALNDKIAGINSKYGKYAANIVVGRLFNQNSRAAAPDAVNAAIFADGRRGGATIDQIEDAYMDSEDLIDEPPMTLSIQGWPQPSGRFSERRAVRRARQLVRRTGALMAGAPHWTVDQMLIHLDRYNFLNRYVQSGGITEEILTREGDTVQNRIDGIIQAERDRLDALENNDEDDD